MHMIRPSMPISASTELTEFLYISCLKQITLPFFGAPCASARGHMPPPPSSRYCLYCFWRYMSVVSNERSLRDR